MLELEVLVVVVGLRSETDFLHFNFHLLGLEFLLALFLLVEELAVVNQSTNGGLGVGADLYEVNILLLGKA